MTSPEIKLNEVLPTAAPTISQLLADLDARPTPASYMRAARSLNQLTGALQAELKPIKLSLLSSYTINSLVPYLVVEGAREGFLISTQVAPFNSVSQELLDPQSQTARFNPDIVVVAQLLEDVAPASSYDFLGVDHEDMKGEAASQVSELTMALETFRTRCSSGFIIHNFPRTATAMLGIAEAMSERTQSDFVRQINASLTREVRQIPDSVVLDFDLLCAAVGYHRSRDTRGWYMGHAPLSAEILPTLARELAQIVRVMRGKPRKCLVLDLDNTLWGGVVGEDGLAGIQIGDGYPGNIFRDFQRRVLQLHQRGALLAINSKNNETDALDVFRSRPEMVLGLDAFAAVRMNWNDKPSNMVSIAEELNIGIDSLVFFDDNPVERALMREMLPEVLTLSVPDDPVLFSSVLDEARPFDRPTLTREDRERGTLQRAEKLRRTEKASHHSLEEFLGSLKLSVEIDELREADLPRVADLFRKTNQFNVTTRRHSAADLAGMRHDSKTGVFSLRASDRFGAHGLVGAAIVKLSDGTAIVDSFLLSCRVIGRGVESALLAQLIDWARARGAAQMRAQFIPTSRNAPSAGFYESHGFSASGGEDDNEWTLDLNGPLPAWPPHISLSGAAGLAVRMSDEVTA